VLGESILYVYSNLKVAHFSIEIQLKKGPLFFMLSNLDKIEFGGERSDNTNGQI
jgi:hypothetical protein